MNYSEVIANMPRPQRFANLEEQMRILRILVQWETTAGREHPNLEHQKSIILDILAEL